MPGLCRASWISGLVLLLSACASAPQLPGEARIPGDARVSHRAVLIGKSNHDTVGTISLYQSRRYPVIVFEPNFRVTTAPGTVVALGADGFREDAVVAPLVRPSGRQAYALPPGLDIRRFNEIWLWNPAADEPVGIARLTPI